MSADSPAPAAALRELVSDHSRRWHVVGAAGSGMSALAQYLAFDGHRVSGSDRAFDQGTLVEEADALRALGIQLFPQDGSGSVSAAAVLTSTAVEARIEDLVRARESGVPVVHRAELLAHFVARDGSIGIAGTSGKSSTTAMVFEILARCGKRPSVIAGGDLLYLVDRGLRGNAWRDTGALVFEADESDRSLVHHHPGIGVVLNLHRDHFEPSEALVLFRDFLARSRDGRVLGDDPELASLRAGALVTGLRAAAELRGEDLEATGEVSRFRVRGVPFELPLPGVHQVENALAAIGAAHLSGIELADCAEALRSYRGVARRFEVVGRRGGILVVDDYAHNPMKVAATVRAAQLRSPRLHVLFQPHGFGPTRFMRTELIALLSEALRPVDTMTFAPIFYAGGQVTRDVSSGDLAADLRARGHDAEAPAARQDFRTFVAENARSEDLVLILGGRDPSLSAFARELLSSLPG